MSLADWFSVHFHEPFPDGPIRNGSIDFSNDVLVKVSDRLGEMKKRLKALVFYLKKKWRNSEEEAEKRILQ